MHDVMKKIRVHHTQNYVKKVRSLAFTQNAYESLQKDFSWKCILPNRPKNTTFTQRM